MSEPERSVQKLSLDEVEAWSQVEGEVFVSDVIDRASEPEAKMTVGFARLGRGEELEISFPYDETLIMISGTYTVRTQGGEELTAGAGEVIFLPADTVNSSRAEEDTEMVYVASPPSVYAEHVAASG